MYVCVYVCMDVCMYVFMYVCMYVCMEIFIFCMDAYLQSSFAYLLLRI